MKKSDFHFSEALKLIILDVSNEVSQFFDVDIYSTELNNLKEEGTEISMFDALRLYNLKINPDDVQKLFSCFIDIEIDDHDYIVTRKLRQKEKELEGLNRNLPESVV